MPAATTSAIPASRANSVPKAAMVSLRQRNLRLLAREPGTEAVVNTGEKAEVLVVFPLGLESVGIGEPVRVSVRGGQREHEARASPSGW
jgi:hypothetical protein